MLECGLSRPTDIETQQRQVSAPMNFRRLKWLAILAPIGFIGLLEYARYALAPIYESWQGHLLMNAVVLLGAIFFYGAVFSVIDVFQGQLERRNDELAAMHSAGLAIVSELTIDTVLQNVVEHARVLLGTRYGALAVYAEDGGIHQFVTSGVDAETAERIGSLPHGKGLLGVVLRQGQRLRLADLDRDPRSCGLPPHHPPMHSLLAVPVVCRAPFRGNLYVSEKVDGSTFSAEDEEVLVRFAIQAGIAVDNAHLHAQVEGLAMAEERLRLAREIHDGQAQVMAFVNTKAQAVRELQRAGRTEAAGEQLEQLAAAARQAYTEVREEILDLRLAGVAGNGLGDTVRLHVERWRDQFGIPVELEIGELPQLDSEVELQLLRIVQEALVNVRKHARAGRVEVSLAAHRRTLRAAIEDDGAGFDPAALERVGRPRFGLAIMRERAEAVGARLAIRSTPGEGTRIEVELPLTERWQNRPAFGRPFDGGGRASATRRLNEGGDENR